MIESTFPISDRAGPVALVTIADVAQAERRIAGVSAIGRVVREIAEAKVSEIRLALPQGAFLGDEAVADIARLAPYTSVRLTSGALAARKTVEFSSDYVVPAADIARFMGGSAAQLAYTGVPVAWRQGGTGVVAASDALPLDSRAGHTLLRRTVKSGDGIVSRLINRRVSRPISTFLLQFPFIRPMHATIGTAILGIAMIIAMLTGTTAGLIWGALLFQAASIFDGVDGEIARVSFRSTPEGASLDSAIDMATNVAFLIGLTFNLTVQGVEAALYLGVWSVCAMVFGLWLIGRRTVKSGSSLNFDMIKHRMRERDSGYVLKGLIAFFTALTSRDGFAFLFALVVLAGAPLLALIVFAAVSVIWLATVIYSLFPIGEAAEESVSIR